MKYTPEQHRASADEVLRESFTVLPRHLSEELVQRWSEAFAPLLHDHIQREGSLQNRGPARYYVTLPFQGLFADPAVYEDPDILAIVHLLAGDDFVMCQLASDTPMRGSQYQDLHRDTPPLFPEWGVETPPFQLAVNFALVDVTEHNGPMEVAPRTHMMNKSDAMARIQSGDIALKPIFMNRGDVLIRDVRAIHRGTPNPSSEPRPMVVLGYSRRWLYRPEVSIKVPRATFEQLSPTARHMLRYNPVVETLQADSHEVYQAFAY